MLANNLKENTKTKVKSNKKPVTISTTTPKTSNAKDSIYTKVESKVQEDCYM